MAKPYPVPAPCEEADSLHEELAELARSSTERTDALKRRTRRFKRAIGMSVDDTGTHAVVQFPPRHAIVEQPDPFPSAVPMRPSRSR